MSRAKTPVGKSLIEELGPRLTPEQKAKLEQALEVVREIVEKSMPEGATFEDYERAVLEITNEIARRELERKLQAIADGHAVVLRIDHNNDWHGWREETAFKYRRHQPGTVTYHSLVGGLRVHRFSYRECYRNGPIYVPLELDAGLMERMTPCLARCVGLGFSQLPIREVEAMLRVAGRVPPSRSTLDRCAKDLGAYAVAANEEIEPLVRARELVPAEASTIVLGLDRTAVAMRNNDDAHPANFVHRDLRRPRPKLPRCSDRPGVSWRMDYVGTVAYVDADGARIDSRQYRLPAPAEPDLIVDRMMADVTHALMQRPGLKIAIVQDGAPELWAVLRNRLAAHPQVRRWTEILDWYHVDERLSKCLDLCTKCADDRERLRRQWTTALLERSRGARHLVRSLALRARSLDAEARAAMLEHLGYFQKRRSLMDYPSFKRKRLPIGSGITEGACKSLIGARAKRSGQHWKQRGLSAALHLRAIVQSGRFDRYWDHFQQRYRATSLTPN